MNNYDITMRAGRITMRAARPTERRTRCRRADRMSAADKMSGEVEGARTALYRRAALLGVLCAALLCAPLTVAAQSAEQFIRNMEANQVHDTSIIEGRIIITDRFGERASDFITYNRGTEDSLLEFTSAAERGQKVLRTSDEIYLFYPDAAEIIRIQGAALRESLLGSDVSYEDMTGNRGLLDDYRVTISGTDTVNGAPTTIVELRATSASDVAYPRQLLWIDNKDYVLLKAEQYALSGKLLKVTETQETTVQQGKIFPIRQTIEDKLKRNSQTEVVFETIRIDASLPRNIFSLEELSF